MWSHAIIDIIFTGGECDAVILLISIIQVDSVMLVIIDNIITGGECDAISLLISS